jgi:hypothetical protein
MTTLQNIAQQWVSDGKEIRPYYQSLKNKSIKGHKEMDDFIKQHTYATSLPSGTYDVSELKEVRQFGIISNGRWLDSDSGGYEVPYEEFQYWLGGEENTRLFITKKEQEVKQDDYIKCSKCGIKLWHERELKDGNLCTPCFDKQEVKQEHITDVGKMVEQEEDLKRSIDLEIEAYDKFRDELEVNLTSISLTLGDYENFDDILETHDHVLIRDCIEMSVNNLIVKRDSEVQSLTQSRDNLLSKYTEKRTEVLNLEYQLAEAKKEIERLKEALTKVKEVTGSSTLQYKIAVEALTNDLNK